MLSVSSLHLIVYDTVLLKEKVFCSKYYTEIKLYILSTWLFKQEQVILVISMIKTNTFTNPHIKLVLHLFKMADKLTIFLLAP